MITCLPQYDPAGDYRRSELADARARYRYDYSYRGMCFLQELPPERRFPPRYMARGAAATLALRVNRLAAGVKLPERVFARLRGSSSDRRAAPSLDDYAGVFQTIDAPRQVIATWREDWCFAWQRVAGQCPVMLQRIDRVPDHFPVTDTHYRRARPGGGSLTAALAEGRLFVADYAAFDGVAGGRTDGLQKHVRAPIALFVATPESPAGLSPVAIQCTQRPGPASPILTPADGEAWALAKLVVQIADENVEGVLVHIGWCHMVAQRFIIAAARNLSTRHPLRLLLEPHFEYTLAVNDHARADVCSPGGSQDRLLGPSIEDQIALMQRSIRSITYDELDPARSLRARGVDDRDVLPRYPFRDDGLLCWGALRTFVDGYVRRHYPADEDAAGDHELRAMIDELGDEGAQGGRLPRIVAGADTSTRAGIAAFIARLIYRVTVYHAAINYSSLDWVGFAPNLPTAAYAPTPTAWDRVGASDWLRMLPPTTIALEALDTVYLVAALRFNTLGHYPRGQFRDKRSRALVDQFQRELEDIEQTIAARNRGRPLPYPYLLPSRITASINS